MCCRRQRAWLLTSCGRICGLQERFFLPRRSSMRKWKNYTFPHSMRCSSSLLRTWSTSSRSKLDKKVAEFYCPALGAVLAVFAQTGSTSSRRTSMRKLQNYTFPHSVRCSPSLLRTLSTSSTRTSVRKWRNCTCLHSMRSSPSSHGLQEQCLLLAETAR